MRITVAGGDSATFSLRMHRYGLLTVVRVAGEVDFDSAHLLPELAAETLRHGLAFGVLVVDLSRVTVFSAAGVRALLQVQEVVAAETGTLVVRAPSPVVRAVLRAVRVLDCFCIDESPAGDSP